MASIVVMGPPAAGARFPLVSKHLFIIGRSEFCDIVLNKRSVSREHAAIFEKNGQYYIKDLESLNGVSVNGRPIREPTALNDGDRINLFDVPLTFYLFDESKAPSSGTLAVYNGAIADPSGGGRSKLENQGRLADLLEFIRRLGSNLSVDVILPNVLEILFHTFPQSALGEILLVESDGQLSIRASKHGNETDVTNTAEPGNRELTNQVIESGAALIRNEGDDSDESALEFSFASTMYVPIIGTNRKTLGIIVLETEDPKRRFDQEDLNLVTGVAVIAGQAISYAYAHRIVVEYERTRNHLEAARRIQLRMLPRECPQVVGYEFAHYYRAAQMVGGDAYIYHVLPDRRVLVAVADASGKGLSASLRIAEFISEVRHCISTASSLKAAMEYLNKRICQADDEFVTFCLAVLDPIRHTLSIANAGHPYPLIRWAGGKVAPLGRERNSFPLGMLNDAQFHPFTVTLEIGDELILFTDGITEAFDRSGNLYGMERLQVALAAATGSAALQAEQLIGNVDAFQQGRKQSDDQCLVIVRRIA